ncbi:hypothetical protein [Parasutterella sp.]|uniref:hypothetical protein n=1 Tax=Parasutterella sp. TaxID=2049037 RepID=UPI003521E07E
MEIFVPRDSPGTPVEAPTKKHPKSALRDAQRNDKTEEGTLRFLDQIKEDLTGGGGALIECDEIEYGQDAHGVICSISKDKWKSLLAARGLKATEAGQHLAAAALFFRKNRLASRINPKD